MSESINEGDEVYWEDHQPWTVKRIAQDSHGRTYVVIERPVTRIERRAIGEEHLRPDWPFGTPSSTADLPG